MDDILDKEIDHNNIRALDNLKYNNFENTHSEDEEDFEDVSTEQMQIKSDMDFSFASEPGASIKQEIKEEVLDLGVDIIMPEASNSLGVSNASPSTPKVKKDVRTRKELEEEEREKMQ